jgi:hypothetical protein
MSQAGMRRNRSKSSDDDGDVPSPENSAQSPKSASSPLRKIVFIQKVALFGGTTPKKALQLIYVAPEWRETVVDFTFDALFFDPFIKPLLQQTPSTSESEKEKEMHQQNEKKKMELFEQFRKVVAFVFRRVSGENEELDVGMKTFLAILFDFAHRKNNNNNNSNDDDSSSVTNAGCRQEVASFLSARSLRSFLRNDDLQDLIINHIAPRVTAIYEFGKLIRNIVQDQESAKIFSNVESFSAILKCFYRTNTSEDAHWIATSIYMILIYNPSSNKLLNSLPVVEAFFFIIPLANDKDAVERISDALLRILKDNEEAQEKFATPEFFKIVQGMEKHATTYGSKFSFEHILGFVDRTDFSKPIANATTSSQLKSVVDALPRHEKYYTEKVRDLLIAKKNLTVDAETADSVVKFLQPFSQDYCDSFRPLLRTNEVHDLIINNIAPHVKAIYEFGGLICNITHRNKPTAELFSSVESFTAILKCFHRSKTSKDAYRITSSINNIIYYNPTSNKLLNSLPVVDAFSFIIPLAIDPDAAEGISKALEKILSNNEEAQKKFAPPEFLKIFKEMEKHATNVRSKKSFQDVLGCFDASLFLNPLADATTSSQLKSAVDSLPRHEKYYNSRVRDLLIAKKDLVVDAETADSVVKFLFSFSEDESLCSLLQTKEVQDLINNIAPRVTAIYEFGRTICRIVRDQQSAVLFSNVESFAAILKCFHRSKTSDDAQWIATSINNIIYYNPSSNKLLGSLPVVEAFSFIIPLANDENAVEWISKALIKILNNNEEAQQKFSSPEFFQIFQGMEQYATAYFSGAAFRTAHSSIRFK